MKTLPLFLRMLWLVFPLVHSAAGFAQQPTATPERITLAVNGLTSETRAHLVRELKRSGDAEIIFACVPAGIIVLEARNGQAATLLETRSRSLLTERSAGLQPRKLDRSLAQAEALCEQARNR